MSQIEEGKEKSDKLSEERFTISYDAPEDILEDHEIDAKDLGEAILGMNTLVSETAKLISNGSAEVKLKVAAPAKEGSLEVVFALLADPLIAAKVLGVLGISHVGVFTGSTVFELVKQIKNRKILSVVIEGDSETAKLVTSDGEITANKYVARLVSDSKVREALHKVVQAPLAGKEGASFKILDAKHVPVAEVTREHIDDFSQLPKGSLEEVAVSTEVLTVRFEQINFGSKKGWRVVLPDGTEHSATINDGAFLERVGKNQQSFQKEDRYEVRMQTTTTYRPTRSTVERAIVEVIRNWDAPNRNG